MSPSARRSRCGSLLDAGALCAVLTPLSSLQIGVGLIPILVIVGWIINQDLTLFFECVSVLSLAVALKRTLG